MTAVISRATVVGGHDGRAEIEVELTYDNGGIATISLDEEACTTSLDRAGVGAIDDLVGQPWTVVLPALERRHDRQRSEPRPCEPRPCEPRPSEQEGIHHARSGHP
jgi:hypothetical protein